MTNDPRDLSGARLQNALQLIGKIQISELK